MTIPVLIDKFDNAELIRNQIAALILAESAAQVALATTASKPDPSLWALRVFTERTTPWDEWEGKETNQTPIINVWWEGSTFDRASSNVVDRQNAKGTFNIDCYGHGVAKDVAGGGHKPGDLEATEAAHRAVRLCRNILMAAENVNLQLQGTVWERFSRSIASFQPEQDGNPAVRCMGARLTLDVSFNEHAPQVEEGVLCYIGIQFIHTPDGELLFEQDIDFEAPATPQQQLFAVSETNQFGTTVGFGLGLEGSALTPQNIETTYGTVTVGEVFWHNGNGGELSIVFGMGRNGNDEGWDSVNIGGTVFTRSALDFTNFPSLTLWKATGVPNPLTADVNNPLTWDFGE